MNYNFERSPHDEKAGEFYLGWMRYSDKRNYPSNLVDAATVLCLSSI